MRKALLGVAFFAVLLSGCRIETNIGVVLEADGSGTLQVDVGFDEEALQLIESGGDQSFADSCTADGAGVAGLVGSNPLDDVISGLQQDSEVALVTEGDLTICRANLAFDDVEAIAGSGQDDGLAFDVTITEEQVRVDASLDTGTATDGGTNGLEDLGFEPGLLEDVLVFHLRVTMPGTVIESNADRTLADGTLEWDIDLFGSGNVTVEAVSDPSGGGGGFPIAIVAVILVVALALTIWLRSRSRRPALPVGALSAEISPPPVSPPPEPPPAADPPASP